MASSFSNPSEPELTEFARQVPFVSFSCVQSRVFHVWKHFKSKRVDLSKPCSGSDAAGCWILECLTPCNRILHLVDIQLIEHEPGKLVLCPVGLTDEARSNDDDAVLDSTFLICWLLKHHSCIRGIDVLKTFLFFHFPSAVRLALSLAANIKSIKVGTYSATLQHNTFLSELTRCASTLEHFEASYLRLDRDAAARLADAFCRASCLKSLVFYDNTLSRSGMKVILKSLKNCTELTSLEICDNELNESAARHLAIVIGHAKMLKDLTLCNICEAPLLIVVNAITMETKLENVKIKVCCDSSFKLAQRVAALLETNRSIKTLRMKNMGLKEDAARVLAKALEVNKHLQKLGLQKNNIDDQGVAHLARVLAQNQTLTELDLSSNSQTYESLLLFLGALSANSSLKLAHFGAVDFPEEDEEEFLNATRNIQFYHKISVSWNRPVLRELARIIERDEDVEKVHLVWIDAVPEIEMVLLALRANSHVTELCLDTESISDIETAKAVALVFETSCTLKTVKYSCHIEDSSIITTMLSGLKNNKSVVSVKFRLAPFDLVVANCLSTVLQVNTTLNSFVIKIAFFIERRAFKQFARCLGRNYTLLSFEVGDQQGSASDLYDVLETTRRNRLFLNRAVRFVLDTCRDADCREAFRVLCRSDTLVQQLSKVTETSLTDARLRVEAALPLVSFEKW